MYAFIAKKPSEKKRFRCAIEFQADYIKATNVNDCIPSSEIVKRYSGIPRKSHENWIKHRNLNERFCCLSKLNGKKSSLYTCAEPNLYRNDIVAVYFFSLPHSLVIVSPFFVPLVYSLVLLFAPSACNRALYTHAIFGICYIYIIFYRVN